MKIFLSSTYLDLKNHRKAVDEIIHRLCHESRGMEYFGSRPYEPKKVCFDEISQCQLIIGIYAHRYGWIPDGEKKSIIEQEFDYASSRGIKCLCYIIDHDYPWPPSFIDKENTQQLDKFLKKIKKLVISTFTTPDNLAKQIAADINKTLTDNFPIGDIIDLKRQIYDYSIQEIESTIGPKYIKGLYVSRVLEKSIKTYLKKTKDIVKDLSNLFLDCQELYDLTETINMQKAENDDIKIFEKLKKSVNSTRIELELLNTLSITDSQLCYPAPRLSKIISSLLDTLSSSRTRVSKYLIKDHNEQWLRVSQKIEYSINSINTKLPPVFLIIDRAGGGKTNLLCSLTEDLGINIFCFFIAAKSIPNPTEDSIVEYLKSVYPIYDDPVLFSLEKAKEQNEYVLFIVDGINESLYPSRFNAALKSIVRRYYNLPIRYIISCRDIYWNYFEDEWWFAHSGSISKNELYSFTNIEYDKAINLYLNSYFINAKPVGHARKQLHHPLLLRFFCEAYKGTEDEPAEIGEIDNISLLELFNVYCDRKFKQIQQRLCLFASDEIYLYVEMIAKIMLENKARLISIELISKRALKEFGEGSIRTITSKYVQILDEDILIEEKPSGHHMNINVGFVYDEFMEYVIAKSIWTEIHNKYKKVTYKRIIDYSLNLLEIEKVFISVAGILTYLGELIAKISETDGLKYVDWLINSNRADLASRILVRWPSELTNDQVFKKLLYIHSSSDNKSFQSTIWKEIIKVGKKYWPLFIDYINKLPNPSTQAGIFCPGFFYSCQPHINYFPPKQKAVLREEIYLFKYLIS